MSRIPDTHPASIPSGPGAKEKPSGLGHARPEHLTSATTRTPFKGTRGPAEVGLRPPSPDFLGQNPSGSAKKVYGKGQKHFGAAKSGSHLENNLRSEKVPPVVTAPEKPTPYMKKRGPVHFVPK